MKVNSLNFWKPITSLKGVMIQNYPTRETLLKEVIEVSCSLVVINGIQQIKSCSTQLKGLNIQHTKWDFSMRNFQKKSQTWHSIELTLISTLKSHCHDTLDYPMFIHALNIDHSFDFYSKFAPHFQYMDSKWNKMLNLIFFTSSAECGYFEWIETTNDE